MNQTEMKNFRSYRTWIPPTATLLRRNHRLHCGLQPIGRSSGQCLRFEQDAYLFLVDQAEGLTDAQRSELEELAKSQNRTLFWDLFNQSVSPVTSYRIESHTLATSTEPFLKAMNDFSERAEKRARFHELAEYPNISTGRQFATTAARSNRS